MTFDLECAPITIENESWIGAFAMIGPGTHVEKGVVLLMGTVANGRITEGRVYSGNPPQVIKVRVVEKNQTARRGKH